MAWSGVCTVSPRACQSAVLRRSFSNSPNEKAGTGQRGVKPLKYFNKLRGKFFISPSRPCSRLSAGVEAEEHQNAVYRAPRPRPGIANRTSTDWNERNVDHRRCRSRQPRGAPSLHAGCDAALFGVHFGCVANDKVHDGQAGTVESGMPRRDGAQGLPPRLSALRILHAWSLPLLRRGSYRRPSMRRVDDCRPATISLIS